jgi:hypothetical protein
MQYYVDKILIDLKNRPGYNESNLKIPHANIIIFYLLNYQRIVKFVLKIDYQHYRFYYVFQQHWLLYIYIYIYADTWYSDVFVRGRFSTWNFRSNIFDTDSFNRTV